MRPNRQTTELLTPAEARQCHAVVPDWLEAVCREAERTGKLVEVTRLHAPFGTYTVAASTAIDPDTTGTWDVKLMADGGQLSYRFENFRPLKPEPGLKAGIRPAIDPKQGA